MDKAPVYTLGYAQWTVDEVETLLDNIEAILVDIRQSPYTTKPGFSKSELEERLEDQYVHLPSFGNVNYKEGPIELANPEKGIRQAQALDAPQVLMCGCRDPKRCHRTMVAQHLVSEREEDMEIVHLRAPSERSQPDLFDETTSQS